MRITLIGGALVITSSLKVEDIQNLKKYSPETLKIKDEEGNDVFAVAYNEDNPSINNKGIVFGGTSAAGDGFATLTISVTVEDGEGDIKDAVADLIAIPATYLQQVETAAPVALAEVAEKRTALKNSIQVL